MCRDSEFSCFPQVFNGIAGSPRYYGYCIELLDALADQMGFDYDIYDSPDGQFGSLADDGSWSGVIKELIEKVCLIFKGRNKYYFYIREEKRGWTKEFGITYQKGAESKEKNG